MKKDLRLHPEYGVNPTIPVCYICGQNKNEVVLLGAAYKEKAPMHMHLDKIPCDKCNELLKSDVLLIEVRDGESGENPYRTGYITAIRLEVAKRVFEKMDLDKNRIFFIEQSVLKNILGDLYGKETKRKLPDN